MLELGRWIHGVMEVEYGDAEQSGQRQHGHGLFAQTRQRRTNLTGGMQKHRLVNFMGTVY